MTQNYYTTDQVRQLVRKEISAALRDDRLDVPTLPHVANQVLMLINRPDVTAKNLEDVIKHDQKLAARVVRVANSPVFAGTVKVTSIQRAVVTIGLRSLQEMIFSVVMGDKIFKSKTFAKLMTRLWEHSLSTGFLAKEIAKLKGLDSEYAFLCGILHDIGKPILLNTLEDLRRKNPDRYYLSDELVDEILLDYHEAVGGLVAVSWNFPDMLKGAIRHHHEYHEAGGVQQMAHLTHVADLFSHAIGRGSYYGEKGVSVMTAKPVYELNMFPEEIKELMMTAPGRVNKVITEIR